MDGDLTSRFYVSVQKILSMFTRTTEDKKSVFLAIFLLISIYSAIKLATTERHDVGVKNILAFVLPI
jgi:hypothetical protein